MAGSGGVFVLFWEGRWGRPVEKIKTEFGGAQTLYFFHHTHTAVGWASEGTSLPHTFLFFC